MAVINFFGYVDFEKTLHEIRGLNVVVRLRKECPIMWPRLTMSSEKYSWLIKNVDAVKDDPLYDEAMGQFGEKIFQKMHVHLFNKIIKYHLSSSKRRTSTRCQRRFGATCANSIIRGRR